ncbi:MAG TPA: biotin--[acetyl-CoA-carboxylase] ligase [Coriobacteriia bacterium]|jgi:BirA family biotin operon repressor/biotin-[acetyl-CoA-carboxylase] ligase
MDAADRADALLAALRAAAPATVSGEALAARLGVSRVAVGKRVAALRAQGYEIEAAAGLGYRLLAAPDLPLPAEVRPLLHSCLWMRLTGGGTTGSTNDDAKALARRGAPEGTVVLASGQTGGRGRLGREWTSPPGGVYLSAVLRPPLSPAEVSPLPLVAGVGLARAFAALGAQVALKWPNDVLLDGGKLAGILVEMSAESERVEWAVVGCGVNVRPLAPAQPGAAYLGDSFAGLRLAEVAAAVLDGLASAYADFLSAGFAAMKAEYESRSVMRGTAVTVRDAGGGLRAEGRVAGVDETGRLVVEGPQGTVAVAAGEVTLRTD